MITGDAEAHGAGPAVGVVRVAEGDTGVLRDIAKAAPTAVSEKRPIHILVPAPLPYVP